MKKFTMMMMISGAAMAGFTSCKKKGCTDPLASNFNEDAKKDDGTCLYDTIDENTIYVSSNITANTTWETGKIYILSTRVAVVSGVTLTIEPGVIVKGEAGTGANATALIIARGGNIIAQGTATQPIIFTSVADEIQPGQISSPNLDPDLKGLWGGLLVLGYAPISADAESVQIEGIPASDQNGLYGGTDPADNSGVIQYVSIRHGGTNIGEGNEINGLTLGGVGSGTTIDHIEILANQDDGVEFFGGTVSVGHLIAWNVGDDAIDTDQSWAGTLTNFIVYNPGDECLELDGPEGTLEAKHTITNGSVSAGNALGLVDNDANSYVDMNNVYFFNIASPAVLDDTATFDMIPTDFVCTFGSLQTTLPTGGVLAEYFEDGSDAFTTEVALGSNTVGVTVSDFTGWTWADIFGTLADF